MSSQPLTTWQRTWWQVCAIVMLITAASCWWQWTWHLDQLVYDAAQSTWTHATPDDVVIVAIDDASVQAIGRWPWKRAIHAQAIDQITQAAPKAILLDLLLSEPDGDPQQDTLLAQAMKRSGKVVLPVSHALDGTDQGHELVPVEPMRQAARLAHADAALDADGSLRWAYMWAGPGHHLYPHPALALMQAANKAPSALQAIPMVSPDAVRASWVRQTPVAVPYLGPPGHVSQVSYAALLRGELPASTFHNRYVLIGASAHGLGEIFQTPVSPSGAGMTGVEVIAQLLASMTAGREIRVMPAGWNALISALLIGLLLLSFQRTTPRQALLAVMGAAGGATLLSWGLMAQNLWWPPCGLALGAMMSYPLWSWRRLEATARDLEAELRTLSTEPGVHPTSPAELGARHADFMTRRTDAISMATSQLRQARQLLAHTLAALPDAVFVVNAQGLIAQANQQANAMSGVAQNGSVIGRHLDDALSAWTPSEAPNWSLLLGQAQHRVHVLSTEATGPKGLQYLVALVSTDPMQPYADVIVCATDVTSLRQAELQRAELLGFIAHDIRSPQASLLSLVELHRIGGSMSQSETLGHVETMARHTLDLCEELLQVMRAETRAISLASGDLIKLCQACLDEMQLQAQAKGIELRSDWAHGTTQAAVFDDYLLHRAVSNLLSNAIKFSPTGGVVSLSVNSREGQYVIAVCDQGPGIPESELGRLFKRYERVEQGRPSKLAAGIGLGLVFIDTVARRHGGQVRVINRPGEGACFELWLPSAQ